ncbi:MAG: TIGR02281 family clan AA aspartic protease [Sphingomonadaceae bacterium]|nr:TIGR02281 family clan AA aspartic protease [Sphingomonadaceae bacterium]
MLLPILLQIAALAPPDSVPTPVAAPKAPTQGAVAAAAMALDAGASATPQRLVLLGPPLTPQGSEVRRAADGLFYVMAIVNGTPVKFLVDTGATMVVLTPDDARRVGVSPDGTLYNSSAETANGRTAMARVTLNEMIVGSKRTEAIDAAVVQGNLPVSLLGQNWLAQLNSITISGDKLHFN